MKKQFDYITFIKTLLQFSPRQGANETKAREYLCSLLERENIPYQLQKFITMLPLTDKVELLGDGKKIDCEPTTFTGGKIEGKDNIISSLISSQKFLSEPNINFNPDCDTISLSNFYFAPSVAVDKNGLNQLLKSKEVNAEIKVTPYQHESANILVGNSKNPKNILIAHYDCHKTGATDNASGVSIVMSLVLTLPQTLKDSLYIFSGNEEISYDKPVYWGHGFRVFEKEYYSQLVNAKKIFVIDCVGNGRTNITNDELLIHLAFPIINSKAFAEKINVVIADMRRLMKVYHSSNDTIKELKTFYLKEAHSLLAQELVR